MVGSSTICVTAGAAAKLAVTDLAAFMVRVQVAAVPDTTRLLNALNLAGLIGTFALHEADRVVLLRFAWHVSLPDMDPPHAYPLLQMMAYHARECAPGIEQVAQGAVAYEQLRAAVAQALQQVQPTEGQS